MREALHSTNCNLPHDIGDKIYTFFDCYANIEFDVLQRLVNLLNGENEYASNISWAALDLLGSFHCQSVEFGDFSIAEELFTRCGLLAVLAKMLARSDSRVFEELHFQTCQIL